MRTVHEYSDNYVVEDDEQHMVAFVPKTRPKPDGEVGEIKNERAIHAFRDLRGLPRYTHIEERERLNGNFRKL